MPRVQMLALAFGSASALLVGSTAAPASAASPATAPTAITTDLGPDSLDQCGAGAFCVWSGTSWTGAFASTTTTRDLPFSTVASVRNRGTSAARVYSGAGGSGSSVCFAPGALVAATWLPAGSVRVLSGASC